jgi:CubicO group peptidase (beta-lactamase class C family)
MKPENAKPIQLDTVMWVASCTKLMTSICALKLVEQGTLTLDDPVYNHIPELKGFKILKTFDDSGKPVEVEHTKPITLRTLLTHTSGLTYDAMHPKLLAWVAYHGTEPNAGPTLLQRFDAPLTFEPGESWMYGSSLDYVGLLIERVTGLTLEEHMRQKLWEPLGIKDMTFQIKSRPDMKAKMADMSVRDGESGKVKYSKERMSYQEPDGEEVQECFGGQGVFTSAEEYIKILQAVLTTDEDEKLLKKETTKDFFTPQLGEVPSATLNGMLQDNMINNAMGGTSKNTKKDWGLGGLLLLDDQPDGKAAGTMIWGGLPNLVWWVDRKTGLCGLYAGQVVPTGDDKCAALDRKFEAAMYEKYKQSGLAGSRL